MKIEKESSEYGNGNLDRYCDKFRMRCAQRRRKRATNKRRSIYPEGGHNRDIVKKI